MFVMSIASAVIAARDRTAGRLDQALHGDVESHASLLKGQLERNRLVVLMLAQNPAFRDYLDASSGRDASPTSGSAQQTAKALGYLEALLPEQVSEVCLIRTGGAEAARVVNGHVASAAELDQDESDASFFGPTVNLGPGKVHTTSPYRSEDTGIDVVGFSTLVPGSSGAAGPNGALVHFELAIDGLFSGTDDSDGFDTSIIDGEDGATVLASESLTFDATTREAILAAAADLSSGGGMLVAAGFRIAFHEVEIDRGTQHRWIVVAAAPQPTLSVLDQFGWLASLTVIVGVVLIGLAARGFRIYERGLRRSARIDPLTALPNRLAIHEHLCRLIASADRSSTFAVMIIDLDRFKEVNDTLGHHSGDRVLQEVAQRLTSTLPQTFVARLGGDEYAIAFPLGSDPQNIIEAAWAAHGAILGRFELDGTPVGIDASFGIAMYPDHGSDAETLIKHADVAMYEAKRGSHRIGFYRADTDAHTPRRLELAAELRNAIEDRSLLLHFQPQYRTADGRLCGVEALARWQHPRHGLVPPAEFVPLAEQTGLVVSMTDLVLDLALAQCRRWLDAGSEVRVSVNVAAQCITDEEFADRIALALATHDVPPRLLRIELTESTLVSDPDHAIEMLERIHDLGVSLSIDDFGTGYSSLAYVRTLPIDELKIDRVFIMSLRSGSPEDHIVRSTIQLGHDLGFEIVAEGIEDQETFERLRRYGCDIGQGFHLSRPAPAGQLQLHDLAERTTIASLVGAASLPRVVPFGPASRASITPDDSNTSVHAEDHEATEEAVASTP